MSVPFFDPADLRNQAAKFRLLASGLTAEGDVASLRQMAVQYEFMAKRIERHLMAESHL